MQAHLNVRMANQLTATTVFSVQLPSLPFLKQKTNKQPNKTKQTNKRQNLGCSFRYNSNTRKHFTELTSKYRCWENCLKVNKSRK